MKKEIMRLISIVLILSMIMGTTLATNESTSLSPAENTVPDATQTEFVVVQNGTVHNLDAITNEATDRTIAPEPLSITMDTYNLPECVEYRIFCSDIDSISNENDKLALAEYIIENYLGYTSEQISTMSVIQRLKIGFGQSIISQVLNPQISPLTDADDEVVNGSMTYRLNYTSTSGSRGTIAITASSSNYVEIKATKIFLSICAQNVACITDSSDVNGSYYYGMAGNNMVRHTFYLTEDDSNYDSISDIGGTGIKYDLNIPNTSTYNSMKNLFVVGTVDINNSSVQPGGAFNVYGNFGFAITYITASVSYPWGITPGVGTSINNNKTQLTAHF